MSAWDEILRAARAERAAFDRAAVDPRTTQWILLSQILTANAETDFGRTHGFADIRSIDQFRAQVPVRHYEELRPWLDRVVGGETGVLTSEAVIAFEETGGSTSGGKLIPYTASSLLAFRAAVLPWLAALAERRPGAFAGKAYVAVSPATRPPRTIGAIPVGMASEGAYLGADLIPAFMTVMAVPATVGSMTDVEQWRFATLVSLLACAELTIVSVWSPTFFIGLLDAIPRLAEPLIRAVHAHTACAPERARTIEKALARSPVDTPLLWPRLDTVSAWANGSSRPYARRLQEMLPQAYLQPKGLLATEGAITTPCGSSWPVPALASAFLEFIDETGEQLLCDELQAGASYRVVMTNAGGFYHYDLGDRLRCHGYEHSLPLLEFIGREIASDLVGEKLSEHFISETLTLVDGTACLVPRAVARPHYALLVEASGRGALPSSAALVEQRLRANPQYDYARKIGQLDPVALHPVDDLLDRYLRLETLRGRRLSDIKPPTLIRDSATYEALTNHVDCDN